MLGNKQFELSNLPIAIGIGNVLTTVSDRKIPHTTDNITIDYYTADITSAQDYYAFGMLMPGRNFSSNNYRFGYNGQEKDDEITGQTGSHLSFEYRIEDTRLGRFLSIDPLTKKYPELTPYQFASNSPIYMHELEGLEGIAGPRWVPMWQEGMTQAGITPADQAKIMQKTGETSLKTTAVAASFAFPILRIGAIVQGVCVAGTISEYVGMGEILLVQAPLLVKATSDQVGGGMEGNTLPTQLLYAWGYNKPASIIDAGYSLYSLKGKPESGTEYASKINDVYGTYSDIKTAVEKNIPSSTTTTSTTTTSTTTTSTTTTSTTTTTSNTTNNNTSIIPFKAAENKDNNSNTDNKMSFNQFVPTN